MDVKSVYCTPDNMDCIITDHPHNGVDSSRDYTVMIVFIVCVYLIKRYLIKYVNLIMDYIDVAVCLIQLGGN